MNLTLSIDDRLAERARQAALALGKSLDQVVVDYIGQLAAGNSLDAELDAFEASALAHRGRLAGWKFDREDANRRR